ncbi:MAG: hypothetical protein QGF33_08605, partial [Alphaproteobacteria bacterium]|nr:hypothetical protein [Alphaproteobacteria bacterium]
VAGVFAAARGAAVVRTATRIRGKALRAGWRRQRPRQRQRQQRGDDAREAGHAKLTVAKQYRLNPGQAGLYQPGDIHSIDYPAGARFVRITGTDMAAETRQIFDPNSDSVRVVEHVGTGEKS